MLTGIVLSLLCVFLYLSKNPTIEILLQRLEAIPYDIRLKLSTPITANETPPILIIDIDEVSLKREGRWPWSRSKLAELISKLHNAGVAVISLDILLAEKEKNPAFIVETAALEKEKVLPEWFSGLKKSLDSDARFSEIIQGKEVVLGYLFHQELKSQNGKLMVSPIEVANGHNLHNLTVLKMSGYTANLDEFNTHSAGSGFFSIVPDQDGSVRRAPLIILHDKQLYPSLALETARIYLLEDSIKVHSNAIDDIQTITHISLGKLQIKTDALGQILIPYLGKEKHFPYISATDILNENRSFPELENAIVFIGTSAKGLVDLRTTPVQTSFPGVEIQANILHGILNPESIKYVPDWEAGAMVLWILVLAIIMTFLYPVMQPLALDLTGLGLLISTFTLNYWLWVSPHINLPIVLPFLLIMAVSSTYVIHYLLRENKDRRRIHEMFGQYVPLDHINKLIETPEKITTEGERREMSVLFSDIRSFTAISEPLSTRELKTFLNHYLTPITKIIFENQGTIDKYVGDMVMAFWGAPLHNPQHAKYAVITALQIQNTITKMQDEFSQLGIPDVAAGIGIHTGDMNVGDMGSDYRRAYTVLGDAVNLGSRLESLTKYYGVKILVSEDTRKDCPEIIFRYIDYVRVKGKKDAIKIYEPVGEKAELTTEQVSQLQTHEQSFQLYLAGDWEQASALFEKLFDQTQEPLYQLYLQRVLSHSQANPENWSGIYTHETK